MSDLRLGRFSGVFAVAVLSLAVCAPCWSQSNSKSAAFRPPAVPLVVLNPYLSVWSEADRLTDDTTRHWTGREHPLVSLIRIDGETYRLMGKTPNQVPALPQTGVKVLPTRSIYEFDDPRLHVTLTFTTPALTDDLEVLARPLTYLTWDLKSVDGKSHDVSIFLSVSSLLAVNTPDQKVEWASQTIGGLSVLKIGTVDQPLLQPAGDDTRVDWGHAYLAARTATVTGTIGGIDDVASAFVAKGVIPSAIDPAMPRAANDKQPVMALEFAIGKVDQSIVSRHATVAYDEIYAVKFLGQKLRPYWRRFGASPAEMLVAAEKDYGGLIGRCTAFDAELMADLSRIGGEKYARIAALAYRQALGGCGLAADSNKQPMFFAKENSSNGCVATVDVIYPAAPQFLLMGPAYAKALVAPALVYSTSPRWRFPFAPHDVGVYPQANGQVYGGGEDSKNEADLMPVEESGNMILLCAAIAKMEGNADFSAPFWPQLTRWENYLEKFGKDPENQLCTDDFMGHLAHNANLSVKAILAIGAYGELCRMRGDLKSADKFQKLAREYARNWMEVAADGDHYRIAFDKPNSWSQKYNLVWDKLLGLNIFPAEVAQKEVAYYKKMLQKFGIPLDSRTRLTKTDWCLWSATMAEDSADFLALVAPIEDYLNQTTARLPFVDSYFTDNPRSDGMRARPVIGGVFIKMLGDPAMWKKWASRDTAKIGVYAEAPVPPKVTEVVATSRTQPVEWRYTFQRPAANWTEANFVDRGWQRGPGGFGTEGTPGVTVRTDWSSPDIWLRRELKLPDGIDPARLRLYLYHDEDTEIYVNGILAAKESGYRTAYEDVEIHPHALAEVKPGGSIVLAVHCHQTGGGQGIDVGFVDVEEQQP